MKASENKTETISIQANRDPKYYLFYCPELDVWSVGRSREEAERNLQEDLDILLRRCSRHTPLDNCCFTAIEIRA